MEKYSCFQKIIFRQFFKTVNEFLDDKENPLHKYTKLG